MKCKNCGEILNLNDDTGLKVTNAWLCKLIDGIETLPDETKREVIKGCSVAHFDAIKMGETLDEFIGDVHSFIKFLETEWGWSVKIDEKEKVLYADENKAQCVCPVVRSGDIKTTLMCNCSEGFAEQMFSKVLQRKVSAKVVSSVLNGDKSCVYEVRWDL